MPSKAATAARAVLAGIPDKTVPAYDPPKAPANITHDPIVRGEQTTLSPTHSLKLVKLVSSTLKTFKIPVFNNRPLRLVTTNNSLTQDFDNSGVRKATAKQPNPTPQTPGLRGTSHAQYLPAMLGQRVVLVNNAGQSGDDIKGIMSRFDVCVKAFNPDVVTMFDGTNSIGDDAALAQAKLDYATYADMIEGIGAVPIGMTIPPIPANMTRLLDWNKFVRQFHKQRGYPLVDIYKKVTVDDSGNYAPGLVRPTDSTGVHPNASKGQKAIAQALIEALPELGKSVSTTPLPTTNTPGHLWNNALFQNDQGLPGGWGGASIAKTYEARADGKGRNLVLTYTSGGSGSGGSWTSDKLTGIAPGDTVRVVAVVSASGFDTTLDNGHNWTLQIQESDQVSGAPAGYRPSVAPAYQWRIDGTDMVLDATATIPANYSPNMVLSLSFATGSAAPTNQPVVKISQLDIIKQ